MYVCVCICVHIYFLYACVCVSANPSSCCPRSGFTKAQLNGNNAFGFNVFSINCSLLVHHDLPGLPCTMTPHV